MQTTSADKGQARRRSKSRHQYVTVEFAFGDSGGKCVALRATENDEFCIRMNIAAERGSINRCLSLFHHEGRALVRIIFSRKGLPVLREF
jgi:hypothetical protein